MVSTAKWVRASGPLTEAEYSTGWGAVQIRFVGALLVGFVGLMIGSILYDEFFDSRRPAVPEPQGHASGDAFTLDKVIWGLLPVLALYMVVNATYMIASPTAWTALPKWLKVAGLPPPDRAFPLWSVYVRAVGALILVTVSWMMYAFLQR